VKGIKGHRDYITQLLTTHLYLKIRCGEVVHTRKANEPRTYPSSSSKDTIADQVLDQRLCTPANMHTHNCFSIQKHIEPKYQFCLPKHRTILKATIFSTVHAACFAFSAPTRVGAILRFFFSWPPSDSFSLSLASRFTPLTELVVLLGVCGGVVIGTPEMNPSPTLPPAEIPGIVPPTSVGLLMIVAAAGVA
jgi:hypothetical protein